MKAKTGSYTHSILVVFALHAQAVAAQSNQLQSLIPGAVPSERWNWGQWTNGVCGEAAVLSSPEHNRIPEVEVGIVNSNAPIGINSNRGMDSGVAKTFCFTSAGSAEFRPKKEPKPRF